MKSRRGHGPECTLPEHLERLRERGLLGKRSLAPPGFALDIEGLERSVQTEPLRRVHECVFGMLALCRQALESPSILGYRRADVVGASGGAGAIRRVATKGGAGKGNREGNRGQRGVFPSRASSSCESRLMRLQLRVRILRTNLSRRSDLLNERVGRRSLPLAPIRWHPRGGESQYRGVRYTASADRPALPRQARCR
jgi:hypothetical protein